MREKRERPGKNESSNKRYAAKTQGHQGAKRCLEEERKGIPLEPLEVT